MISYFNNVSVRQHCIRYPWDLNTLEFYDYAIGIFMFSCWATWMAKNIHKWKTKHVGDVLRSFKGQ